MSQLNVASIRNNNAPLAPGIDIGVTGNVSVDTDALFIDVNSRRVGVGTASPTAAFDVSASGGFRINSSPLREKFFTIANTINASPTFNVIDGNVQLWTSAGTASWTLNVRGNASTTFNNLIETNASVSIVAITTLGGSSGFSNALQIDGVAQTIEWSGGSAPTARGGTSGYDVYQYIILKIGSASYTVFGSTNYFN